MTNRGIDVGESLPEWVRTTDLGNWNRYAAVNDEFVPIHMDAEAARAIGQPDVFGMGNLRLAYLHALVERWLGGSGDLAELACEFRGLNLKGDMLTARGTITGVEARGEDRIVELALSVVNQDGKETTPGSARATLFGSQRLDALPEPPATAARTSARPGVYLDEPLLSWLGRSGPPSTSFPVGENDIRRWALAVAWPDRPPAHYYDPAAAARTPFAGLVAPRDFNPFAWAPDLPVAMPWLAVRKVGPAPGGRILNGGQHNRYFAPIRPGDVIRSVSTLVDAYEREGRLGTMLFLVGESRWVNQRAELVRLGTTTLIYY